MRLRSRVVQATLLILAYAFAVRSAPLIFSGDSSVSTGYKYMVLLTAALLLLAAHGYWLIRRSQVRRLDDREGAVQDVTTDVTMSILEIFLGWMGIAFALVALYYFAPANDLSEWHPRLFLCLAVLFGATYQRALIFVSSTLPFVLPITILALWQSFSEGALREAAGLAVFLIADFALLAWAARLTREHGAFSVSQFEMPDGAGLIGGALAGVIRNQQKSAPESGYQLDLSCIRQTKLGGQKAQGEVLWHARKRVRGDLPGARYSGSSVPVNFMIPAIAPATLGEEGFRISWALRATAEMPDTTFACAFEVPVESSDNGSSSRGATQPSPEESPGAQEPATRDYSRRSEAGAVEFVFPASWNSASELVLGGFVVFWAQLIWLATASSLDWSVWVMFGAGLWFLGSLLTPWAWKTETSVASDAITVNERFFGLSRRSAVGLDDVKEIVAAGDGARAGLIDASDYHRVEIRTRHGKSLRAGRNIRSRKAAQDAAGQMAEAVAEFSAR